MILIDLNQIILANILATKDIDLNEDLIRNMVLRSIRAIKNNNRSYGEVVICCDSKNYWRKDIFPYYKANRKKNKENSTMNWDEVYRILNMLRQELMYHFPYKVLHVERCEADDIIATIVKHNSHVLSSDSNKILIVSGDKDFGQLHIHNNVFQLSPSKKKEIQIANPEAFLREQIIRGDSSDGVPNMLSKDSSFVNSERQKSITQPKLKVWMSYATEEELINSLEEYVARNYQRNKSLIDLTTIPLEYENAIMTQYNNYKVPERRGLMSYFIKHRLKQLMPDIGDF